MYDLGLNVVKKVRYTHFTSLQHLSPSQTFITTEKINNDSKGKKLQKVCMHEDSNPVAFGQ